MLDAFAVMAFLNEEPGVDRVKELHDEAKKGVLPLLMHLGKPY